MFPVQTGSGNQNTETFRVPAGRACRTSSLRLASQHHADSFRCRLHRKAEPGRRWPTGRSSLARSRNGYDGREARVLTTSATATLICGCFVVAMGTIRRLPNLSIPHGVFPVRSRPLPPAYSGTKAPRYTSHRSTASDSPSTGSRVGINSCPTYPRYPISTSVRITDG
jgi:hypothetical protein